MFSEPIVPWQPSSFLKKSSTCYGSLPIASAYLPKLTHDDLVAVLAHFGSINLNGAEPVEIP